MRIRCIFVDSKNHAWICSYGNGLFELADGAVIATYDSSRGGWGNRVRACLELDDGTLVSSDDKGLAFTKNGALTQRLEIKTQLPAAMVLSLSKTADGTLLAGTNGDGICVIRNGEVQGVLTNGDGLTSGVILRTVTNPESPRDSFVVTSTGLCYLESSEAEGNTGFSVRALSSFPYYNNYDIQPYKDSLFITGSAGIYVVKTRSLTADSGYLHYELLDAKSGLTSALTANAWNCIDDEANYYLACGNGVFIVNMDNYRATKRSFRMMLSSVRVDGELHHVERGEPFVLNRDSSRLELFPEVINYTVVDPYVSYRLEGFDFTETLIPQSALSSVVYTNLPSGNYTFHIAVLDGNGSILEKSRYEFIKEKEIYDNRWFRLYMMLVAMIAIAWFTWFIAKTQIYRVLELQKRELAFAREQVRMGNETILAIAKTVDAKDENTSQHSMRVSEYSVMIAKELGFSAEECENLRKAALLHDIGKIGIPDRILNKPSRLTDEEYAVMKSHVTRGAEILKDFTMIDHVSDGVLYHHEHYDGSGYAQGLKGEEIPIYGRIIGAADAFDAMTANRVYRKQLDFDYVVSELKRCRGTQFDPHIIDIIYEGDEITPYTNNFIRAQRKIEDTFRNKVETIIKSNVPVSAAPDALEDLVQSGCGIIFANSYGYCKIMKEFAAQYPKIQFCSATGDNANTEPFCPNYHTFMGEIYQGRYISGVVAGMKLQELLQNGTILPEQAKIGYVAAYPFAEVISGYTSFLLGVHSIVPGVKMDVIYTNSWNSYSLEKEYTKRLINDGCIIISQHSDTIGPAVACEESIATTTVFHIGYNQSMIDIAPTTSLISSRINWIPYMTGAVQAVLENRPIESLVHGHVHKNDIGAGFEQGWVQMMELNSIIAAPGTAELIQEIEKNFIQGKQKVFYGEYEGVNPHNADDVYDLRTEYKENQKASAPSFCYVLKDVITIKEP